MSGRDWKLNKVTLSPFRNETNPSFIIGNRSGSISFIDFGDLNYRGDCFTFVKLMFNFTSLDDVLKKINSDFGLGIGGGSVKDYRQMVGQYKQPTEVKRYSLIQVVTRKFTNAELDYWNSYHQSLDDLKDNNVYAVKKVFLNRQLFPMKETEMVFGYLYDGHWKIYFPQAKDKKRKWLSNVPLTKSYGLNNLKSEHNSLICKSLKDYLVCKKVYPYVCHVQNESLSAFSEETVNNIKQNSNEIFYGGDSDRPGKDASFIITKAFGFNHINPPDNLLPDIKDFADWGKEKGLRELENHFIKKRLFGSFKY